MIFEYFWSLLSYSAQTSPTTTATSPNGQETPTERQPARRRPGHPAQDSSQKVRYTVVVGSHPIQIARRPQRTAGHHAIPGPISENSQTQTQSQMQNSKTKPNPISKTPKTKTQYAAHRCAFHKTKSNSKLHENNIPAHHASAFLGTLSVRNPYCAPQCAPLMNLPSTALFDISFGVSCSSVTPRPVW